MAADGGGVSMLMMRIGVMGTSGGSEGGGERRGRRRVRATRGAVYT